MIFSSILPGSGNMDIGRMFLINLEFPFFGIGGVVLSFQYSGKIANFRQLFIMCRKTLTVVLKASFRILVLIPFIPKDLEQSIFFISDVNSLIPIPVVRSRVVPEVERG